MAIHCHGKQLLIQMNKTITKNPGSFRDPSGYIFEYQGNIYRFVSKAYKPHYDQLHLSGLYDALIRINAIIATEEVTLDIIDDPELYKIIRPEHIPFISYPYEWSFGQLKEAALLTLKIQKMALQEGMVLKDASAYNIQFLHGRPVFIDTLSFEKYEEGQPWPAYKQFCQHFLAPLFLISYNDIRLNQLSKGFLDGVPLDLTSKLLPKRTYLNFCALTHIHLHSKTQQKYSNAFSDIKKQQSSRQPHLSLNGLMGIIDSLESGIHALTVKNSKTEWSDYYDETNYSNAALKQKMELVAKHASSGNPGMVWDIGANNGFFSRLIAQKIKEPIISFDIDPMAVEINYQINKSEKIPNILPLLMDFTNSSPGIGWENKERLDLISRGPCETAVALALIHHLVISNNVPLDKIANFFSRICDRLIIEFIPKSDSQVQRMLSSRKDIFESYDQLHFEREFSSHFDIVEKNEIPESDRTLYFMKRIHEKDI